MRLLSKYKTFSFDTNPFIYYFQRNPEFGSIVKNIFLYLQDKKADILTSNITLVEIMSVKMPESTAIKTKTQLLSLPGLKLMEIKNDVALKAAEIRRLYGFELADSLQLASAVISDADVFITNDFRLKRFKEVKVLLLPEIKV